MSQMTKKQPFNNPSRKSSMPVLIIFAVLLLMAAISVPAYAMDTRWSITVPSTWFLDTAGQAPVFQTNAVTDFTVNENNAGGYDTGNMQGLGQIFAMPTTSTIRAISIKYAGLAAGDYELKVYEIGPTADYARNMPDPCDFDTLEIYWNASLSTTGVSDTGMALFNLTADEAFTLNADTKYAFVITYTVTNALTWMRGTAGTLNGMMITTNGGGAGANVWKNIRDYGGTPTTDPDNVRQASLALWANNVPDVEKATIPTPADGATGVNLTQTLSWTASAYATSHDVYFGTESPGELQGNQSGTTFDPGTLDPNTTYYWRIDEIDPNATYTGDVWSFTTLILPPDQASDPDPEDAATDVDIDQTLSWTADINATSHDVYFGTDFNDVNDADITDANVFIDNQTETTYDPGTLEYGTTYYWRIDEKNDGGTTAGEVWSFTTEQFYDLNILKMTVKAGKTQGADANDIANIKDSFTASGTFEDVPDDLDAISQLDLTLVSLDGDDTLVYSETIPFSDYYDSGKNRFKYTHKVTKSDPNGAVTSLMLNFSKDPMTFSIKTKNIDLTGLACPLQLNMWLDDTVYSGNASESIVNGSRKTIQTRLMRMFNDTLIVTKAKATANKLSVKGEIAVEDINNTDLDEPDLVVSDVNIIWGDQTFTLLAGSLEAYKTGHRYKCSKVDVSANGDDGLVTAKFDLDKCTFNLSIKEAASLDTGATANVEFGINYGDANETDFDEVKDVNLPTGRSI